MMGLTPQLKKCLDFIQAYSAEQGEAPLYKQIQHHMGFRSTSNVSRIVNLLEERGAIHRVPNMKRALTVRKALTAILVEPVPEVRRAIDAYAAGHDISAKTAAEQALSEWFLEPTS